MNVVKATFLAATLAAASLSFGGAASAAPVGAIGKAVSTEQTSLQQVHYRRYKHRHYRKYRHNRYGYYRGYRRPGVSLYIGPRYGHYRHHRRYWR
jgi:outer membrane lipoprotein-sorting protein